MNTSAIYHRPESEFAYLYNKATMHIRLQTAREDVKAVYLVHGDPYLVNKEQWYQKKVPMQKLLSTQLHDYWQISVGAKFRRIAYGFIVEGVDGTTAFYGDQGIFPATEEYLSTPNLYYRLPYFHQTDRVKVPEWVKQTVWYQIFPERFANGDTTNDPKDTLAWGSEEPTPFNFFGGDLQGVRDHLDHLVDLGVNGLYFCPIFKATSNHKYDTEDYFTIDPAFGDDETFKALVEECHARGIKVMLDAVFNHIGDNSPQWQDVIENGEKSKYADWFHIHEFPVSYTEGDNFEDAKDLTYDTFAFTPHMPKLNTANPEVQEYLLSIAKYWIEKFDIDAWRLGVANEVDHAFWKKFRQTCDAAKKDFYILGEIWHSSQRWLQGDEFDAVMNYAFTDAIKAYFVKDEIPLTKMVAQMNQQLMLYRMQTNQVQLNVLDSHDTPRLLTEVAGDKDLARQIMAFTYLQMGVPCVYYGTEYAMEGEFDPGCRKCMVWDEKDQDLEMYEFMKLLIAFRKDYQPILSEGSLEWLAVDDRTGIISLARQLEDRLLVSTFNTGDQPVTMPVSERTVLSQNTQENQILPKGFVITYWEGVE